MRVPKRVAAESRVPADARLVLLVGQAPDWQLELGPQLAHEGYRSDRVGCLEAVLPLLAESCPLALIVEAHAFAASDLLLLRRVRERSPGTAIVVIARTPKDPDLKHAFESGATAFLSWPSSPDALRRAVESVKPGGGT